MRRNANSSVLSINTELDASEVWIKQELEDEPINKDTGLLNISEGTPAKKAKLDSSFLTNDN